MKSILVLCLFFLHSTLFTKNLDVLFVKNDSISVEKGIIELQELNEDIGFEINEQLDSDIDSVLKTADSVNTNFSKPLKSTLKPFTYAGTKRYTVDGEPPNSKSHIDFVPAAITVGVVGGACTGIYLYQKNAWWSDNRADFHIQEDGAYSLYADKLGHFYGGYIVSYLIGEGIIASGVPFRTATALGALGGMLYQTFVEIQDGYGSNWGFSPSDAIANYLGAWYYLAQHEIPVLQNFTPKVQFVPSRWVGDRPMVHETAVFDDYHSMTYHLSFEMDNILPNSFKQFWPNWLNLSIGYNVRNMEYFDAVGNPLIERNIVIGLDYNLTKLIPETNSNLINWLVQTFNHYKFPSPAIVIGKDVKFALMFPFFVL
jgi:hypothetical protein